MEVTPLDDVRGRKKDLRARLSARRDALGEAERHKADAAICNIVASLPEFMAADVLLTYLAMGSEVETRDIIRAGWAVGKRVALPRVTGHRQMRWFEVEGPEDLVEKLADAAEGQESGTVRGLERSRFGVLEPPVDQRRELFPAHSASALAVVPGFTFDRKGYRLGYGGGFYDAFLTDFPGTSVGVCRAGTLVECLDVIEPHDQHVQLVATDHEVVRV